MQKTGINYLTHSWNPIAMRCTPVSAGCANCWSIRTCDRFARMTWPDERAAVYRGERGPMLLDKELGAPLRLRKPARIGVQFMGDLFHEDVPFSNIRDVFITMLEAPQHTFLLLTKRPARMKALIRHYTRWMPAEEPWPDEYQHVWLGVTVEDQSTAWRAKELCQIPAALRWLSIEPMLSSVEVLRWLGPIFPKACPPEGGIGWVACGCESGPNRRPTDIDWIRDLRDQCVATGTPLWLKQMDIGGKVVHMPELDGRRGAQVPEGW